MLGQRGCEFIGHSFKDEVFSRGSRQGFRFIGRYHAAAKLLTSSATKIHNLKGPNVCQPERLPAQTFALPQITIAYRNLLPTILVLGDECQVLFEGLVGIVSRSIAKNKMQ